MDVVTKACMDIPQFAQLAKLLAPHGISPEMIVLGLLFLLFVLERLMSVLLTKKAPIALSLDTWIPFKIQEIEKVSPDTKRFVFALQSPEHTLGR